MLNFKFIRDPKTHAEWIETSLAGKLLLTVPQLNKGTAFPQAERHEFGLLGKLPAYVESLEEQVQRAYLQYQAYTDNLQKYIFLNNQHDKNQVMFFKLVSEHLAEMLPVIYTPTIGAAVKQYSREFRQARGLYIAYSDRDYIAEILDNRSHPEIDLIVATDGEGILGIGDQGVGGMDIPIAKLMVYTLCAGVNPLRTLPIMLDVGTNNQKLLDDPLYLGVRHKRIQGAAYDDFIKNFVDIVKQKFPQVFLHWEDFGRANARRNLERFRDQICSFNDDIQGTGVAALAALLAAVKATGTTLEDHRVIIFGAGTAGTGIADQICAAMVRDGLSEKAAREHFWLVDRQGLLLDKMADLTSAQLPYVRDPAEVANWQVSDKNKIGLLEVIKNVKPTILIGSSAQKSAFTQLIIQTMAAQVERPIILPLSNPIECCEVEPQQILEWTNGKALFATGSPFPDVVFNGRTMPVAQCNNAFVFPGIGLGVVAVKAKHLSDDMLWAACKTLRDCAPVLHEPTAQLLPPLEDAREIARKIAIAVATEAQREGLARVQNPDVTELIDDIMWYPHYIPMHKQAD